jgi:sigma-B regulation protein RsbU (phosphoserine phosphatase)
LVLAGMEEMKYSTCEIVLEKGDELFLYTDGVTEAANNSDELFGEERLLSSIKENGENPLKEFSEEIKLSVDKFADGAEQADDITMLVLRYKGN